jgi:hypothetical protein
MKFKIGDRVVYHITNKEGVVIATDGTDDEIEKVKVKFDGFFGGTGWCWADMLRHIITN